MPRLQIDISETLHARLKADAKSKGKLFRPYVIELLERVPTVKEAKELAIVNPQVKQVIEHFQETIGTMSRMPSQRKSADRLIKARGFERVMGAIKAAKAAQGQDYAPVINNLVALEEKWVSLEGFYKRSAAKQLKRGVKIR